MRAGTAAVFAGTVPVNEFGVIGIIALAEFGEVAVVTAAGAGMLPDVVVISRRAALAKISADDFTLAALRADLGGRIEFLRLVPGFIEKGSHLREKPSLLMFRGRFAAERADRVAGPEEQEEEKAGLLLPRFVVTALRAEQDVLVPDGDEAVFRLVEAFDVFRAAVRTSHLLIFVRHGLSPRRP